MDVVNEDQVVRKHVALKLQRRIRRQEGCDAAVLDVVVGEVETAPFGIALHPRIAGGLQEMRLADARDAVDVNEIARRGLIENLTDRLNCDFIRVVDRERLEGRLGVEARRNLFNLRRRDLLADGAIGDVFLLRRVLFEVALEHAEGLCARRVRRRRKSGDTRRALHQRRTFDDQKTFYFIDVVAPELHQLELELLVDAIAPQVGFSGKDHRFIPRLVNLQI